MYGKEGALIRDLPAHICALGVYLQRVQGVSWLTAEAPANFSGLVTVVKFQESRLRTFCGSVTFHSVENPVSSKEMKKDGECRVYST